jgi:hypothetical protein
MIGPPVYPHRAGSAGGPVAPAHFYWFIHQYLMFKSFFRLLKTINIIEISLIVLIACFGAIFGLAHGYPSLNIYLPLRLFASLLIFFGSLVLLKLAYSKKDYEHVGNLFLLLCGGAIFSIYSALQVPSYCKREVLRNIWWCLK